MSPEPKVLHAVQGQRPARGVSSVLVMAGAGLFMFWLVLAGHRIRLIRRGSATPAIAG